VAHSVEALRYKPEWCGLDHDFLSAIFQ
jgi:hypothetical protein